jgi:hypothetical protein
MVSAIGQLRCSGGRSPVAELLHVADGLLDDWYEPQWSFLSRMPVRITWLSLFSTIISCLRNVTSMPPSQTTRIENKGLDISRKTVAVFNLVGRVGMSNSTVATDCMLVLLAHWTSIGSCVTSMPGQFGGTRWPVAAVSG